MGYQVNMNGNHTNINPYLNRIENEQDAGKDTGSVRAATDEQEALANLVNGDLEPVNSMTAQVEKNTEQVMELLEKNGAVNGDDGMDEEERREHMKEVYRSLTPEEIRQLKMMQIDITSADISDLMGIVSSMRGEAHEAELQARIAAVCKDIDALKGDLSESKLKEALSRMLPEELADVQLRELLSPDYKISGEQTVYLLKNELPLTVENLYKSDYATTKVKEQAALDADVLQTLAPRMEELLANAGIAFDGQSGEEACMTSSLTKAELLDGMAMLVANDVPLTEANIRNYAAICEINQNGVDLALLAKNMLENETVGNPPDEADAYFDVRLAAQRFEVKLQEYDKQYQPKEDAQPTKAELTARRQIEEIRLSMMSTSSIRLAMKDIHIDTRPLADIVDTLKELEQEAVRDMVKELGVTATKEQTALLQESLHKLNGLQHMPAASLVIAIREETVTVNRLYEEGMTQRQKAASDRYETLMTAPRSDMGDSISKAFREMDSLLDELDIPLTEANRRATRILAYNSMELTEANLTAVKTADGAVNSMLQNLTPESVWKLIKNHQNPLEMTVDELSDILKQNRGDEQVKRDLHFGEFLVKLQRKGDISEKERESYIGIYRLMDKITKHSGRDIGTVVKNGQELTLANLLSAHRSNQAKGINRSIDDSTGMLDRVRTKGKDIAAQIAAAFDGGAEAEQEIAYGMQLVSDISYGMTPQVIDTANPTAFGDMGLEAYKEWIEELAAGEEPVAGADTGTDETYTAGARELFSGEHLEAESFLLEQGLGLSADRMTAAIAMQTHTDGFYRLMKNFVRQENLDEDDRLQQTFAAMADHIDDTERLTQDFDLLSEELSERAYDFAEQNVLSMQDIQALKQIHTGLSMLSELTERAYYHVPVVVDGEMTVMSVQFVNAEDGEQGKLTFSLTKARAGRVNATVYTGEQARAQIETENYGERELPEPLLLQAKNASDRAEKYALAKRIMEYLVTDFENRPI